MVFLVLQDHDFGVSLACIPTLLFLTMSPLAYKITLEVSMKPKGRVWIIVD